MNVKTRKKLNSSTPQTKRKRKENVLSINYLLDVNLQFLMMSV